MQPSPNGLVAAELAAGVAQRLAVAVKGRTENGRRRIGGPWGKLARPGFFAVREVRSSFGPERPNAKQRPLKAAELVGVGAGEGKRNR